MKLVRYVVKDQTRYGILEGEKIKEIKGSIFEQFEKTGFEHNLKDVKLLFPCQPSKIVAIGLNYKLHAEEAGMPLPKEPMIFLKPPSAIIGPGDNIIYPAISQRVDYEAELAVVIKKRAKFVSRDKAPDYILGYTCLNDVTARDLQKKDGQFDRSKGIDTFAPFGPCIETELDPTNVKMEAYLNGEVKQSTSTSDMVFDVYTLVEHITKAMTLERGDIITTGTPSGIGPMKVGDKIEIRIEGIGSLVNQIVAP